MMRGRCSPIAACGYLLALTAHVGCAAPEELPEDEPPADAMQRVATPLVTPWTNVYFEVGRPWMIHDESEPGSSLIEGNPFALKEGSTFHLFAQRGGRTERWSGPSLTNLGNPQAAGPTFNKRYCGALATDWWNHPHDSGLWIRYAERDNGVYRGWAHGETFACYGGTGPGGNSTSYASVHSVHSNDGGLTWHRDNAPLNNILLPQNGMVPAEGLFPGLRQPSVVKANRYYMFVDAKKTSGERNKPALLRSAWADKGAPGTWEKFDGTWGWQDVDVDKGNYHRVRSATPNVTHPISPGYAISHKRILLLGPVNGEIRVSWSDRFPSGGTHADPRTFEQHASPLIPVEPPGGHLELETERDYFGNASIVGPDGHNRFTGRQFYLYYALRRGPDAEPTRGNLVARNVWIRNSPGAYGATNRIMLRQWYAAATSDHWATTAMPSKGYTSGTAENVNLGWLKTADDQLATYRRLVDCRNDATGRHIVRYGTNVCASNESELRVLGYIYRYDQDTGTVPVYRCNRSGDWMLGTSVQCNAPGTSHKLLLGYIISP